MVAKENQKVCVITYKHSVTTRSRLHGILYNKEVSISRSIVPLTLLLHSENEPLLTLSVSQKLVLLHCDRGVICKYHSCAIIAI